MQPYFLSYKTSYLNEEVNRTDPSPSVSLPCSSLLYLIVSDEKKSFITFSTGQLNFNLPSIFSRLSKTAQNVAVAPKLEPLQEVVPTVASCTDNDTHFELITGA